MRQAKRIRLIGELTLAGLAAGLAAGCGGGGGGGGGPTLDTAMEVRRIGALTRAMLDFSSVFLPLSSSYLDARAGSGPIDCPGAGIFTVTSPAAGQFEVAYDACDVEWATLDGSLSSAVDGNDLLTSFDLAWNGVRYEGLLRHKGAAAASTPAGLTLVSEQATLTPAGGLSYNFEPDVRLQSLGGGTFGLGGHLAVFLDPTRQVMDLSGNDSDPARVAVQNVGTGGNFVRVQPPTGGKLLYGLRRDYVWVGAITSSATGFSVTFANETTHQDNFATASSTWSNAMATPQYDPTS